nr:MAG TPA: hypothetical protein [Caudoviricetes sp.]DAS19326.1 MAG TPA: hypothetical protein [Caudoviricetes sp.]DAV02530.1 MAG TPA: hypothetical protein [Caudoviricetes sp.]DAW52256.1 MAG TPA: hypothetical protein [Caudoviricetes sp.]
MTIYIEIYSQTYRKVDTLVFCIWLNKRFQGLVTAFMETYIADMNYVE